MSGSVRLRTIVVVLSAMCAAFAALGVLMAVAWDGALLEPFVRIVAREVYGLDALPQEVLPFAATTFGILGGTIVGKWVAAAALVAGPLARGERWAVGALAAGLVAWFCVEATALSIAGAPRVVMVAALPAFVAFGVAIAIARRAADRVTAAPEPTRAERWLQRVCWAFVVVGIVVAIAPTSMLFSPYTAAIARAWYGGALPEAATTWQQLAYAPIGATFVGHFTMLALAVRHGVERREVSRLVILSMSAWFVVDSTTCIAHGAWFNVAMINVPSFVAVAVPWCWARARAGGVPIDSTAGR